jgi:hypothetical protein
MDENLSSILSSIMNNPVSNWARRMGGKMAGGDSVAKSASHYPYQKGIQDWSKIRATQRPGVQPEAADTDIYKDSAITKLAEGRTVGFEDFAFPKNEKMPDAVQRQEGMGLNNIADRHGSFPLTKPPFGVSGTPEMGYDYTNEGYTDFTPMGYDYTNEGYADLSGPWAPSYADEYAGERSPLNAVSQADWSSPDDFARPPAETEVISPTVPQQTFTPEVYGQGELYPGHAEAARDAGAGGILGLLSGRHGKWIDQNKARMKEYGIPLSLGDKYSSEDWEKLQRIRAIGG